HLAGDVFAKAESEPGGRARKFVRLNDLAEVNDLTMKVGHLDAHSGLARDSLDKNRFRLHRETQIIDQVCDAAVLDSCFGLEFKGGNHGSRMDLSHRAHNAELCKLFCKARGALLEFMLVNTLLIFRRTQEGRTRQFEGNGATAINPR